MPLPESPVKNSTTPRSLGGGPVLVDDGRDLVAQRGLVRPSPSSVETEDGVVAGVRGHDLDPQGMVLVGVAVRGERYGDHVPRPRAARPPRGWHAARPTGDSAEVPCPTEGHQDHPTLEGGQPGDLVLVEGVGDGDERGARVLLGGLGGVR